MLFKALWGEGRGKPIEERILVRQSIPFFILATLLRYYLSRQIKERIPSVFPNHFYLWLGLLVIRTGPPPPAEAFTHLRVISQQQRLHKELHQP